MSPLKSFRPEPSSKAVLTSCTALAASMRNPQGKRPRISRIFFTCWIREGLLGLRSR